MKRQYKLALLMVTGQFDTVERYEAKNNRDAIAHAQASAAASGQKTTDGDEWCVLDLEEEIIHSWPAD